MMPADLLQLLNGLFLLLGILGILYYLNIGAEALDADLPPTWAIIFLVAVSLAFYHFFKVAVPDKPPEMKPGDKFEMRGGAWLWK